jgi:hypothetical protein
MITWHKRLRRLFVEGGWGIARGARLRNHLVDPGADGVNLFLGQRIGAERHRRHAVKPGKALHQHALGAFAGDDNAARDAASKDGGLRIKAKLCLRFVDSVALDATGFEDGFDLSLEVNLLVVLFGKSWA